MTLCVCEKERVRIRSIDAVKRNAEIAGLIQIQIQIHIKRIKSNQKATNNYNKTNET
jgi:hypothetical protein